MPINEKYIGGSLDDFLKEEGIYEEVQQRVARRVLALQLDDQRKKRNLSKVQMAKRMRTSRSALDRILDPGYETVTLDSLERAARAVGCSLHVSVQPIVERKTKSNTERMAGGKLRKRQNAAT